MDGTRRSIREYRDCNWGQIPGDAVVTTSAKSIDTRQKYQKFIAKLVELFGSRTANPRTDFRNTTTEFPPFRQFDDFNRPFDNPNRPFDNPNRNFNDLDSLSPTVSQQPFQLFQSSPRYGLLSNLLFQDDTVTLKVRVLVTFFRIGFILYFEKCVVIFRQFLQTSKPTLVS